MSTTWAGPQPMRIVSVEDLLEAGRGATERHAWSRPGRESLAEWLLRDPDLRRAVLERRAPADWHDRVARIVRTDSCTAESVVEDVIERATRMVAEGREAQ